MKDLIILMVFLAGILFMIFIPLWHVHTTNGKRERQLLRNKIAVTDDWPTWYTLKSLVRKQQKKYPELDWATVYQEINNKEKEIQEYEKRNSGRHSRASNMERHYSPRIF